jgi:ATP-dependent protease ClpP protease subunit
MMTHRLLVGGELLLYGDVGDRWGDGSGFTDMEVIEAVTEHGFGPLTARLNSGGGFAHQGVSIYNTLKMHGNVSIQVDAIAASAASLIAMAGTKITMLTGSMMMIHDPSGLTIGTAKDHMDSAGVLNKIGDLAAKIYAQRTGKPVDEVRAMMLATTWLDAEEAVNAGFATDKDSLDAVAASAFDYTLYANVPDRVPASAQRALPPEMIFHVTNVTQPKEPVMATPNPGTAPVVTAATDPAAIAAVVNHADEIFTRCETAKLSMAETAVVMKASNGDLDKGRDAIIAALAARDTDTRIVPTATVTADARDRFAEGVSKSLMSKAGLEGGEINEFSSMTLREIARASLVHADVKMSYSDPMTMVGAAFTMQHSTSDFTSILANIANKSMLKGYMEAEETFDKWTIAGTLSDFKVTKRVDLNLFPSLALVDEGAEYSYATIGDRGESVQLATYGKMFSITRQAIINDDMSMFTRVPGRMGRAAKRTIGNMVYAVLTGNPLMSDGVALFHATHNNLGAGTFGVTGVDAARVAMAKQKDPDGHAVGGLNIRPSFALVPVELEGKALALMASEFDPATTQKTPNHVRGIVSVISEARLSTASAAEWYLAANGQSTDTVEVSYLNGNSQPMLEQKDGWNVDGVEFKVRQDAAVKALDFRGLYKSSGV